METDPRQGYSDTLSVLVQSGSEVCDSAPTFKLPVKYLISHEAEDLGGVIATKHTEDRCPHGCARARGRDRTARGPSSITVSQGPHD
jgi:hypothetical protein